MTDDMKRAQKVADQIRRKIADALAPLEREMRIMQWPAEFQVIMWDAVAEYAGKMAGAADRQPATPPAPRTAGEEG